MIWPFSINWAAPVTMRLEWLTEIQLSKNDTEFVTQLRAGARRQLSYQTVVGTDAERVAYENMLIAGQANVYQLPWWPYQVWITAPINAGANVAAVTDIDAREITAGSRVVIINEQRAVIATVQAAAGNSITFTAPVFDFWPVSTRIVPLFDARIQAQQPLRYLTDTVMTADVVFTAVNEWQLQPAAEAELYYGYPVFLALTAADEDVVAEVSRSMSVLDNATGIVSHIDMSGFSRSTKSHRFVLSGATELNAFFNWLAARQGRYGALWVPSNQRDFTVQNPITAADTVLLVANYQHALVAGSPGRTDILITLQDGTRFYREIEDIQTIDATTEAVFINEPLGQDIDVGDIAEVCYMRLCRLASDAVEVSFKSDAMAVAAVSFLAKRF